MDSQTSPDRRKLQRRKLKLQKIFAAEFIDAEDAPNCFLHIYDLSERGMRVHTDHVFPDSGAVPLRLFLDQPIELRVHQIWRKELFGGMQVVGLEFDGGPEALRFVRGFMERYSPDNKRASFRLQRILVVEMLLGSTSQKFGVFTLDISASGMRISHDFPLPEEVDIPFRILLEYDRDPIEVVARVTWQEENTLGQYVIGLQFTEIGEESIERIDDFIEFHRSGSTSTSQAFAPLHGFDDHPL